MLRLLLLLAFVGIGVPAIAAQAPSAASPAQLADALDRHLQPLLRTNNFSGAILVMSGERVIIERAYGLASIEHQVPNRPDTLFQIASLSKPFTSAAIMRLVEEGKLELEAPLAKVLPDYPRGDKLTIHHLLSHTSGIPNINDFDEYEDIQRKPHTPVQLVAYFKDKPLEFEPGARYSYSNSNYNLLALVIEKASGSDYGSYLERAVLAPAGLKRTGHTGSAAMIIPGIATGYSPAGSTGLERASFLDWSVKTGNGSLHSTALDVATFIRAVHRGQLLKPASVSATFRPHTPTSGYGWFLSKANGRDVHHVNGRSPGFAAHADHYVADDVTVVVLANTYVSVTTDIARAAGALVFGLAPEPMPALRPDPLKVRDLGRIVGDYQFGEDYYVPNARITVRHKGGHVEAMVGDYGPYAFVQITPTRFLIRSFWTPAEFTLGVDGRATTLTIDGRKGVRVPEASGRGPARRAGASY